MNIRLKSVFCLKSVEKFIKYNVIYSKPLNFSRFDSKMSFDKIDWKSLRPCNNFILHQAIAIALCKSNHGSCWIHPAAQSTLGEQQWDSLVSEHSVGFQIKIGRPKFCAGEMIMPAQELGTIVIGAWPSFLVWSPP